VIGLAAALLVALAASAQAQTSSFGDRLFHEKA
jgi:hypothetical protein